MEVFVVEIQTKVGMFLFGPFATKEEAAKYLGTIGVIRPLFQPTAPARDIMQAANVYELFDLIVPIDNPVESMTTNESK